MNARPKLPPLYDLVEVAADADSRAAAVALARGGAGPATLVWSPRRDRLDAAVVLAPDCPLGEAVVAHTAAVVALGDAIGSLVPAGVDARFEWPGRVLANAGAVAGVTLDAAASADVSLPVEWLVVAVDVAVTDATDDIPVQVDLTRTTLRAEGCQDIAPGDVLASFARYFMSWINRFEADGFAPVRAGYLHRWAERGKTVTLRIGDTEVRGTFEDITEDGALVVLEGEGRREITLAAALGVVPAKRSGD